MNSFTNTILTLLLGWLRTLLNAARDFISSDSSTAFFAFFRENWKTLFVALCIVGFALDIIVYLVRWRPRPVWSKRQLRRRRKASYQEETYDFASYNADTPAIPTDDYEPVPDAPYGEYATEPTVQYQIQSRQGGQQTTAPVTIPYTTPYFAPEANAYQEEIPQLYTDEPTADQLPYLPPVTGQAAAVLHSAWRRRSAPHRASPPTAITRDICAHLRSARSIRGRAMALADSFAAPVSAGRRIQPAIRKLCLRRPISSPAPTSAPSPTAERPDLSPLPEPEGLGAVAKRARHAAQCRR